MLGIIEQHRLEIIALCMRYRVKRLELFGSAASGDFDSAHSDIDFFYEFDKREDSDIADRFFGLKDELGALLGHDVDLVSALDAKNPYFLQVANRYRQTLYAA
jgi:predicted nucleotidyltransferase